MNVPHSALHTPHLEAVLFDLDGTLIHSIEHIIACWQHTVRTSLGREMAREEIIPTLGRALLECFEEIAPGRSVEMREVYRAYQKATHDTDVTLVTGTHETLKRLRSAGYRLGVVTSKGITVATEGLDLFNLTTYFDTLVTYEDTERHKPHPDPLHVASERLGIEPAHMLYVGDAVFDIQAGKAAGMHTIGVTWGAGKREDLVKAGADLVIDEMEELTR
ncbi:MAG TPA: HAD-IA family hydrolase [Chloroflexia bacterium]|nr:HAD-IA family hydrolase [Chloroflexia bacterium]